MYSYRYIQRTVIPGSYSKNMFILSEISKLASTGAGPPAMYEHSFCSTSLLAYVALSVPDLGHSNMYILVQCQCQLLCCGQLFVTPRTVPHQAPLSMEFSREEYWSGLPCSPLGDLPNPGIEPKQGLLHCRRILYHHSLQGSSQINQCINSLVIKENYHLLTASMIIFTTVVLFLTFQ